MTGGKLGPMFTAPFRLGQSGFDLMVVVGAIALLAIVEFLQRKGSLRERLGKYPAWVRATVYVTFIFLLVIFRAQTGTKFIYAGF